MSKTRIINEFADGILVWYTADGRLVQDSEGNIMNIPIENIHDLKERAEKVAALKAAAEQFGFGDGTPNFWSGNRRVSEDEYNRQLERSEAGLIPDIFDRGAIQDEYRTKK